jgi:glucosamine--fructose-6-phosphate aminotransferase (isomerizing)
MALKDEIAEQPAVAERLLTRGRPQLEAIADGIAGRIRDRDVDQVVIAARGTSDHAAIYAQYLFGAHLRLPVALAAPSLITLYGVEVRLDRALVIGISQSGQSPDIVSTVAAARSQGAPTVAITNEVHSELAGTAEHVIDLGAGPERAVAATKTFTAQLMAVALLVTALESRLAPVDGRDTALSGVPAALAAALETEPDTVTVARHLKGAHRLIVVGRGFEYATARELALKLKELARLPADPYSAADFLHGPLALVEPGHPVIAIATSGAAAADIDALLERLGELGVERIVISDRPAAIAGGALGIQLPQGLPEWLMPIVAIVPGQLLAMHLAIAKGIDPENPRWIRKVTLTR